MEGSNDRWRGATRGEGGDERWRGQSEVVAIRGGRKQSEVERSYQRWRGVIRGGGERPEL